MKKIHIFALLASIITIIVFIIISENGSYDTWSIGTLLIIVTTMGIMFFQFEKGKIASKEISLIAILSGVSAISRVPFAAIPSVQPCTYIIICTGYVFWTIFQMFAWGIVGVTASILPKLKIKSSGVIIFGIAWGYLFGWITNLWIWLAYIYPHTFSTLLVTMGASLGFDTFHALGNAIFLAILGEKTITIFQRYKNRFHIKYRFKIEKEPSSISDCTMEPSNS